MNCLNHWISLSSFSFLGKSGSSSKLSLLLQSWQAATGGFWSETGITDSGQGEGLQQKDSPLSPGQPGRKVIKTRELLSWLPARASTVPQLPPARPGESRPDRQERGLWRETPWGLPQCIQLSRTFSFMWSWAPGLLRCRRHRARPEHNGLKKTGSCPQGASRSDKPGQVRPPPRGLVLCERWQEAQEEPRAHAEDQGSSLFHLEKPSLPLAPNRVAPLTTLSDLSPSLVPLPKN